MDKEIIYYTTNKLDNTLLSKVVRDSILKSGLPIISVSQKPLEFGKNIVYKTRGRSQSILYNQILTGLKTSRAKYVFFCEHDVLYHHSHFDFIPTKDDTYYYNNNALKYRISDRRIVGYDAAWLSQLCANRKLLIQHYTKRLEMISLGQRAYGYEPGTGQSRRIDKYRAGWFESEYPNIDVRHGDNWTGVSRMYIKDFKDKRNCQNFKVVPLGDVPGWDKELLMSL